MIEDSRARETLEIGLEALICEHFEDPGCRIDNLNRLTGGSSRETWAFDALLSDGRVCPLILRRDPPGTVRRQGNIANEVQALRAAASAHVPEPDVLEFSEDQSLLGSAFMIVERIEGETIPRRILRDELYADLRSNLAWECGSLLARIHSVPHDCVQGLPQPDQIAFCAEGLAAIDEPHPVLELALRWLRLNYRQHSGEPVLVHGDFRNGNLIVGPEGVRAVLDWEVTHWGDPAEDLGFLSVRAWRFGGKLPVGGFGTYEQLLAGYAAAGGREVSLSEVKWWEILGTLRWALSCLRMTRRHLDGEQRSVELAAIGRRTCEQEWDLINLIERRLEEKA